MIDDYLTISLHLGTALLAGALIGLERTFHGRPAGFRTHALVALASSLLMLLTLYQDQWAAGLPTETIRLDPTRMAQGIMTGIGFLGAGVIFKEGLSVRGLTTAASIWITAAIGILLGVGFYFPAAVATVATLGILSAFRWIEMRLPTEIYAHFSLKFRREATVTEDTLRELMKRHGFSFSTMSYRLTDEGRTFEYRMVIRTTRRRDLAALSHSLRNLPDLMEFRIVTAND
jgi:putative Mg2+ transporter-C (MgtC) family protein